MCLIFEPEKWIDILEQSDLQEVFCTSWLSMSI